MPDKAKAQAAHERCEVVAAAAVAQGSAASAKLMLVSHISGGFWLQVCG